MKILLVDDDPEILHVARVALERMGGHRVVCAASGAEALAEARREAPDAIVLDALLPDVDAAALLAELRRGPAARTPIVLLTARPEAAGNDPDVAGVIEKPFDPLALAGEVARLIGRPR